MLLYPNIAQLVIPYLDLNQLYQFLQSQKLQNQKILYNSPLIITTKTIPLYNFIFQEYPLIKINTYTLRHFKYPHNLCSSFSQPRNLILSNCQNIHIPPSIHTLKLTNCLSITNLSFLQSCPNLHFLELDINHDHIYNINSIKTCIKLQSLIIHHCIIPSITFLQFCTNLHTLELYYDEFEYKKLSSIDALRFCPKLQTLNLHHTHIRHLNEIRTCSNLKSLTLYGTIVQNIDGLSSCPNLRILSIYYLVGQNKLTNINVLTLCPKLHTLIINGSSINTLYKQPNLRYINLLHSSQLVTIDDIHFSQNLLSFIVCDASNLTNIDKLGECTNLQLVKLINCINLTNIDALDKCTHLQHLVLMGCGVTSMTKRLAEIRRCFITPFQGLGG